MSAATIRVFHKLWHRSIYPKPCSFTLFPPPPTQLRHPLPFSLPPPLAAIIPTLVSSAQRTPHFCTPSSLRLRRRNVQKISLNARSLVMRQWALKEREGNSPDFVPPSPSPHLVVCLPTKGDEEKMESSRARRVWRRLVLLWLHSRQPLRVFFLHGLLVWMRFPRMGSANDIPSLSPYLFVFPLIPSLRTLLCTRASPQE